MIVLVFPKEFEYSLFVSKCDLQFHCEVAKMLEVQLFNNFSTEKARTHLLCIKDQDSYNWILCVVIGDSDVGFNLEFIQYLISLKDCFSSSATAGGLSRAAKQREIMKEFIYVLCGTCGGPRASKIGDCFVVNKAYKFDRGSIANVVVDENGQITMKMTIDRTKMTHFQSDNRMYRDVTRTAIALSSNFLTETSCEDLARLLNIPEVHGNVVAEMETFEFFAICTTDLEHDEVFGCIRIVSDIFGTAPDIDLIRQRCDAFFPDGTLNYDPITTDQKWHTLGRKSLDFSKLVEIVISYNKQLKAYRLPSNEKKGGRKRANPYIRENINECIKDNIANIDKTVGSLVSAVEETKNHQNQCIETVRAGIQKCGVKNRV